MKIGTAVSPDAGRTEVPARAPRRAEAAKGGEGAKPAAPAADRADLGAQPTSVRAAGEAARLAAETRALIAQNNREALLAQAVDVGRLLSLVG